MRGREGREIQNIKKAIKGKRRSWSEKEPRRERERQREREL